MKNIKRRKSVITEYLTATGIEKETIAMFEIGKLDLSTNNNFPCYINCIGCTNPDPNYDVHRNDGREYSIEYILEGEGYIEYNGVKYRVKKGDSFVLKPRSIQHYYSDKNHPFRKIWVNFFSNKFDAILKAFLIDDIVVFPNVNIRLQIERIFALEKISSISEDISITGFAILTEIIAQLSESVYKKTDDSNELFRKIKLSLENGIYTLKNLKPICDQYSISENYLVTEYRKEYGIPPYKYILDLKIEKAKELLTTTNLSIVRISEMLCFYDAYSFSNQFKKHTGISPTNYKAKYSQIEN